MMNNEKIYAIRLLKGLRTDTTYFDFRVTQINSTEARSARKDLKEHFFFKIFVCFLMEHCMFS